MKLMLIYARLAPGTLTNWRNTTVTLKTYYWKGTENEPMKLSVDRGHLPGRMQAFWFLFLGMFSDNAAILHDDLDGIGLTLFRVCKKVDMEFMTQNICFEIHGNDIEP